MYILKSAETVGNFNR